MLGIALQEIVIVKVAKAIHFYRRPHVLKLERRRKQNFGSEGGGLPRQSILLDFFSLFLILYHTCSSVSRMVNFFRMSRKSSLDTTPILA